MAEVGIMRTDHGFERLTQEEHARQVHLHTALLSLRRFPLGHSNVQCKQRQASHSVLKRTEQSTASFPFGHLLGCMEYMYVCT